MNFRKIDNYGPYLSINETLKMEDNYLSVYWV